KSAPDPQTLPQPETKPDAPAPAEQDVGSDDEGDGPRQPWFGTPPPIKVVQGLNPAKPTTATDSEEQPTFLTARPTIIGAGVFLLLVFHVPPFRRAVFRLLRYLWWIIRGLLWDIPMGVWRSPAVRGFRQSRPVRFLFRHFWSPLVITALAFA